MSKAGLPWSEARTMPLGLLWLLVRRRMRENGTEIGFTLEELETL